MEKTTMPKTLSDTSIVSKSETKIKNKHMPLCISI
jgi:hypothetical protein